MAVRTAMMLLCSFVRAQSNFINTTHSILKYAFMLFVILSTMIGASAPIVNGLLRALIFIFALAIVYFIMLAALIFKSICLQLHDPVCSF
ncbi:hypothetical protein RG959_03990 [Domibacillus sp. 8LH]|uniref:hypothetical protein n=1 Tax=Domibacillus sp. 8LH TaxID=3073900 RepID=UPI003171CF03